MLLKSSYQEKEKILKEGPKIPNKNWEYVKIYIQGKKRPFTKFKITHTPILKAESVSLYSAVPMPVLLKKSFTLSSHRW